MEPLLNALPGAMTQGIIWAVMAIGVYLSFRVLNIADLTVDGSFATGGATLAMLIRSGMSPWLALLIAFLVGMLAGAITGGLHTVGGIPVILTGILTQLALYSINLRIMGGRSNQPLSVDKYPLLLSQRHVREFSLQNPIFLSLIFVLVAIAILYHFFGTEIGSAIRATGSNATMARAQGIHPKKCLVVGLAISNGLVALSGGLLAQYQGAADINMGRGSVVIGLAAVIVGEAIQGKRVHNFGLKMGSVVLGSMLYFLVLQIVLFLGLNTNDLKMVSAIIVAIFLSIPHLRTNRAVRQAQKGRN